MRHLSTFALAVGQDERAIAWGVQAFERAKQIHQVLSFAPFSQDLIPTLILHHRYDQALAMAQDIAAAVVAATRSQYTPEDTPDLVLDPEALLGPRRPLSQPWQQVEEAAAYMTLLPLMAALGTASFSEQEATRTYAQSGADACRQMSITATDEEWWTSAALLIDNTYVHPISARELNRLANAFDQEQDRCLRAMSYFGSTLQRDCSLKDALNAHGTLLLFMSRKYLPTSATYRRIILPFFTTYWRITFERRRVFFSSPRLVGSELEKAYTLPESQRAQAILKAVALGIDADADIIRQLQR